jgi:hypothetical protein
MREFFLDQRIKEFSCIVFFCVDHLLAVSFSSPFFIRTAIYYPEMLIFSQLIPFGGLRWSSQATVRTFPYGGGCL